MKRQMKNVPAKSSVNCLRMYMSSFLRMRMGLADGGLRRLGGAKVALFRDIAAALAKINMIIRNHTTKETALRSPLNRPTSGRSVTSKKDAIGFSIRPLACLPTAAGGPPDRC